MVKGRVILDKSELSLENYKHKVYFNEVALLDDSGKVIAIIKLATPKYSDADQDILIKAKIDF